MFKLLPRNLDLSWVAVKFDAVDHHLLV